MEFGSCKHLENQTVACKLHMVSEATHSWSTVMELLEAVISMKYSGSYKGELIREFNLVRDWKQWDIRQIDGIQKEFNVWAVINFNCKEVPINPIIKSRTHYY
jgi:hypothetical protein